MSIESGERRPEKNGEGGGRGDAVVEALVAELGSASLSSRPGEGAQGSDMSEVTALVPYVPPPRNKCFPHAWEERVFLHGIEIPKVRGVAPHPPPHLPLDVFPTVLSYCDAPSLSRASCVCRDFRRIARRDDLWENLCRRRFGVSAHEIRPRPDPTRLLYILTHRRFREVCRADVNPFTGRTVRGGMMGRMPTVPFAALRGTF